MQCNKNQNEVSEKPNQSPKVPLKMTETKIRIRDPKNPLLQGKYSSLLIRNFRDNKNSNSTTATFYDKLFNSAVVLTSDATIQLIGQSNYDYLFNNLIKTRDFTAILSLLTSPKITTLWGNEPNESSDSTKPPSEPFFTNAQDIIKKINLLEELTKMLKCDSDDHILSKVGHLLDQLKKKELIKCNCKNSLSSTQSTQTKNSTDGTENVVIKAMDGSNIILPFKPKDLFHIVTKEITENYTTKEEKHKLQCLQAVFDWKLCTKANEEGYLPIHIAASQNDVDLIKRHGAMLKAKGIHIDITNNAVTALQMAITSNKSEATECLLAMGADVTQKNNKEQNLLHIAASYPPRHMKAIIKAIKDTERQTQQDGVHNAESVSHSVYSSNNSLLSNLALTTDIYGDTPLMLACRAGNLGTLGLLVNHVPDALYIKNPSSGNTVLHVAMIAALNHFEYLHGKPKPSAKMLRKREEILSMLGGMIKLCNTQIKNYNNMSPVDLVNQTRSDALISFVADQLNNRHNKTYRPSAPVPQSQNHTSPLVHATSPVTYTVKSDVKKKNVLKENGLKLITSPGNPKITVLPDQTPRQITLLTEQRTPRQITILPKKTRQITLGPEQKTIRQITLLPEQKTGRQITLLPEQTTGRQITLLPEQKTTRAIPVLPEQKTRQITIKRNNTISKVSIAESPVGRPSKYILVSDDRSHIAGVLTKVNIVKPNDNKQPNAISNGTRPRILIHSNKLFTPPPPPSKPKTYIVKIKPQDKHKLNPTPMVLKRKLPIPYSPDNKRSLLKVDNT